MKKTRSPYHATKRDLVGRTIVDVEFHRWHTGRAGKPDSLTWTTSPVLILDNGHRVYFSTDETESGEYGTRICINRGRRVTREAQVGSPETKGDT